MTLFLLFWSSLGMALTISSKVIFESIEAEKNCRQEMRLDLMPLQCFVWLRSSYTQQNVPTDKLQEAQRTIDQSCLRRVQVVEALRDLPQVWIDRTSELSPLCRKTLQQKVSRLMYVAEENDPSSSYEFLRRLPNNFFN